MGIRNFEYITMGENTAVREILDGSGDIPIPATEGGSQPKYVMLVVTDGTAGDIAYITPQIGAGAETLLRL